MFDGGVFGEFQIAAGTVYQGPVQRPPGSPADMGTLPAATRNVYSYGANIYSHANLIFYLNIHDVWSGVVVLNGILGDFSPLLTTVSFTRFDT
jgi:hypothetical protein